ncbi:hypothetical protein CSC12_1719 [Klebsiella michiganensis]|nr:hypothetical protein CSC12_1719 [Klebsiella michiganensis]
MPVRLHHTLSYTASINFTLQAVDRQRGAFIFVVSSSKNG